MQKRKDIDLKKITSVLDTLAQIKGASIEYKNNTTNQLESYKATVGKDLTVLVESSWTIIKLDKNGRWYDANRFEEFKDIKGAIDDSTVSRFFSTRESDSAIIRYEINVPKDKIKFMGKKPSFFTWDFSERLNRENVKKLGGFKLVLDPPTVAPTLEKLGVSPPVYKRGEFSLLFESTFDITKKQDQKVEITPTP